MKIAYLHPLGRGIHACDDMPFICLYVSEVEGEAACLLLELSACDSDRQQGRGDITVPTAHTTFTRYRKTTYLGGRLLSRGGGTRPGKSGATDAGTHRDACDAAARGASDRTT